METDKEFFERMDRQTAEILTPAQETTDIMENTSIVKPMTLSNNKKNSAFDFQIDFKDSYEKFVLMTHEDKGVFLKERYDALMTFIKLHHGKFKKKKGEKGSGLKFAHECGERGAEIIILFLATKGWAYVSKGNDNRYDFILLKNGEQKFIELKTDTKHMLDGYNAETDMFEGESENAFFETAGRSGKSGIRVTESPVFITYFPIIDEMYISDTLTVLKHFIGFLNDFDSHKITQPSNSNITFIKKGIKFHWKAGDPDSGTKGFLVNRIIHRSDFFTYVAKPIQGNTIYTKKSKVEVSK